MRRWLFRWLYRHGWYKLAERVDPKSYKLTIAIGKAIAQGLSEGVRSYIDAAVKATVERMEP